MTRDVVDEERKEVFDFLFTTEQHGTSSYVPQFQVNLLEMKPAITAPVISIVREPVAYLESLEWFWGQTCWPTKIEWNNACLAYSEDEYATPPPPPTRTVQKYEVSEGQLDRQLHARELIIEAIAMYRGPRGYAEDLADAADTVEQMGTAAWPALKSLANQDISECEFFVGAIVRLPGVSIEERREALISLTKNSDSDVRGRLLEHLFELPPGLAREVASKLDEQDDECEDVVVDW